MKLLFYIPGFAIAFILWIISIVNYIALWGLIGAIVFSMLAAPITVTIYPMVFRAYTDFWPWGYIIFYIISVILCIIGSLFDRDKGESSYY